MSSSVHFFPIWSTLVLLVYIGPTRSIMSTSVLLVLFSPICSYFGPYVHFGPKLSIHSYSVNFGPIQFTLFPFSSILSIQSTSFHLVHLCLLRSIFMHIHISKRYVWVVSTYSKSKFIKNIYIYLYIYISNS